MGFLDRLGASVLAGGVVGLVVGGVGGRLAMFVLRHTSPDSVDGLTSDDGFEIGQVTLSGTYALLAVATAIGIVGAMAFRLVRPWLLGPPWFRRATAALGAGAVIGSMLVHADGVDFTRLEPVGLAVAFFVAIPAMYAAVIGDALDYCERSDAWVNRGRWRRRLCPAAVVAGFPPVIPLVAFAGAVSFVWAALRSSRPIEGLLAHAATRLAVRVAWLAIAVLGLAALVTDVRAVT